MMRKILIFAGLVFLAGCGQRAAKPSTPAARAFPSVEVPSMLGDPGGQMAYAVGHFWDRFTDTAQVYACDSTLVNGVPREDVESQVGQYATWLDRVPVSDAVRSVAGFFDRLAAFERKYPDSNVFEELVEMTCRYLYDANSPVRNEEYYLPFVERLAASDLVPDGSKTRYGWEARMCGLNRLGTPAADFRFIDTKGQVRSLYGIRAEYVLLIFANPGCSACRELTARMDASPEISDLIDSGRLKVVDVYIDRDIDDWKAHIADYPPKWINGYDRNYTIRTDLVYSVRAIPSIYLLDASKRVLMKDAPQEKVLGALAML